MTHTWQVLMSDSAILVENLSKQYRIGKRESYKTLSGSLTDALTTPAHKMRSAFRHSPSAHDDKQSASTIWSLRDVSFEVKQGEVIGVIGRNGAGKSTLLKILARITEPTEGHVRIRGRVASLLEVGTGFHQELTGRENIYLNGAILGMKRAEIGRKFDEIVAFAEVERFIDTPVKHYSSGMYLRLAFAVAAHLEPEILLVDEVLAVGDAAFQKKCLGKMGEVAREGRTVLFVSHNMVAVGGLCSEALLLSNGELEMRASSESVIRQYLNESRSDSKNKGNWFYRHRGKDVRVDAIELRVADQPVSSIQSGLTCTLRLYYSALSARGTNTDFSVSIMVFANGQKLVNLWTNYHQGMTIRTGNKGYIDCIIEKWPFRSGLFRIDIWTSTNVEAQDWIEECLYLDSTDGDYYDSGVTTNSDQGIMFLEHRWVSYAN